MSDKIQHETEVKKVAQSVEQFSKSLYGVIKGSEEGNILFSPFSVAAVLAILSEGARGDTLEMMMKVMHLPETETLRVGYKDIIPALRSNDDFTLDTANTAFVMKNFELLKELKTILQENYHADISQLDFSDNIKAARIINDWVKTQTRDMIKDLVSANSLNSMTRLVLVNAVYFKGDWETQFKKDLTTLEKFWVSDAKSKDVQMMKMTSKMRFAQLDEIDCSMIELPYKGRRIVMQVVLPEKRSGVFDLENKLAGVDLEAIFFDKLEFLKVDLKLPRFKLTHSLPLSDSLKDLGMGEIFNQRKADFSGIGTLEEPDDNLFVSSVVQKVLVDVNEEGSKAAAATGMFKSMMPGCSRPEPSKMFHVDHPFIFYIKDSLTGMVLFQGRVVDPSVA